MKPLAPAVLAVLLVLPACHVRIVRGGTSQTLITGAVPGFQERAEKREKLELRLGRDSKLSLHTSYGRVSVNTATGAPYVEAHFVAHGRTRKEAEDVLGKARLVKASTGAGVDVAVERQPYEIRQNGNVIKIYPEVHLTAVVPAGTRVRASSSSGNVGVHGPLGSVEAESSYGKVVVEDIRGDVTATSKSGSVDVRRVRDGDVEARSGYGSIELSEISGGRVQAETASGGVALEAVHAREIQARSSYGRVRARDVRGRLQARSKAGPVTVAGASGTRIEVESGYGDIEIEATRADIVAKTGSGSVTIEADGGVEARSNYGRVRVRGALTSLTAHSRSGAVEVDAHTGTKPAGTWELKSGYGSISVTVPADFSCELTAATTYGRVECDFPVLVQPGKHDKKTLRGRIGDGGPDLRAETSSGNITIRRGAARSDR